MQLIAIVPAIARWMLWLLVAAAAAAVAVDAAAAAAEAVMCLLETASLPHAAGLHVGLAGAERVGCSTGDGALAAVECRVAPCGFAVDKGTFVVESVAPWTRKAWSAWAVAAAAACRLCHACSGLREFVVLGVVGGVSVSVGVGVGVVLESPTWLAVCCFSTSC